MSVVDCQNLFEIIHNCLQQDSLSSSSYESKQQLAQVEPAKRLAAAFCTILDLVSDATHSISHPDEVWLDVLIGQLDVGINKQLDVILHHPDFQALESSWRSIAYLVAKVSTDSAVQIEVLDVAKNVLWQDFQDARDLSQAGLYHHLYQMEYDMPGGDPITAMVSDYFFTASVQDIFLLKQLSALGELTHCPLLANVAPQFFDKDSYQAVLAIENLSNYLERAEYLSWVNFRNLDQARYVALFMPRFLLRLVYGDDNPTRDFCYQEYINNSDENQCLWGAASFAFAANMIRSFEKSGWLINIRGPESGGKVNDLQLPRFKVAGGVFYKSPTEVLISESKELELADLGFIPLSYYKNSNYACFFSANSVKAPVVYSSRQHTANSRVNAKLPYIFLVGRLGHYLKVLQREVIGSDKTAPELAQQLNTWLQTLVTKMRDPAPELACQFPLREGYVAVEPIVENPGYFRVNLFVVPHFQVEGIDIRLSLVAKLPGAVSKVVN